MKLSARNVIKGKILESGSRATTANVKLDVGGAADAVIKVSDVMVGKD